MEPLELFDFADFAKKAFQVDEGVEGSFQMAPPPPAPHLNLCPLEPMAMGDPSLQMQCGFAPPAQESVEVDSGRMVSCPEFPSFKYPEQLIPTKYCTFQDFPQPIRCNNIEIPPPMQLQENAGPTSFRWRRREVTPVYPMSPPPPMQSSSVATSQNQVARLSSLAIGFMRSDSDIFDLDIPYSTEDTSDDDGQPSPLVLSSTVIPVAHTFLHKHAAALELLRFAHCDVRTHMFHDPSKAYLLVSAGADALLLSRSDSMCCRLVYDIVGVLKKISEGVDVGKRPLLLLGLSALNSLPSSAAIAVLRHLIDEDDPESLVALVEAGLIPLLALSLLAGSPDLAPHELRGLVSLLFHVIDVVSSSPVLYDLIVRDLAIPRCVMILSSYTLVENSRLPFVWAAILRLLPSKRIASGDFPLSSASVDSAHDQFVTCGGLRLLCASVLTGNLSPAALFLISAQTPSVLQKMSEGIARAELPSAIARLTPAKLPGPAGLPWRTFAIFYALSAPACTEKRGESPSILTQIGFPLLPFGSSFAALLDLFPCGSGDDESPSDPVTTRAVITTLIYPEVFMDRELFSVSLLGDRIPAPFPGPPRPVENGLSLISSPLVYTINECLPSYMGELRASVLMGNNFSFTVPSVHPLIMEAVGLGTPHSIIKTPDAIQEQISLLSSTLLSAGTTDHVISFIRALQKPFSTGNGPLNVLVDSLWRLSTQSQVRLTTMFTLLGSTNDYDIMNSILTTMCDPLVDFSIRRAWLFVVPQFMADEQTTELVWHKLFQALLAPIPSPDSLRFNETWTPEAYERFSTDFQRLVVNTIEFILSKNTLASYSLAHNSTLLAVLRDAAWCVAGNRESFQSVLQTYRILARISPMNVVAELLALMQSAGGLSPSEEVFDTHLEILSVFESVIWEKQSTPGAVAVASFSAHQGISLFTVIMGNAAQVCAQLPEDKRSSAQQYILRLFSFIARFIRTNAHDRTEFLATIGLESLMEPMQCVDFDDSEQCQTVVNAFCDIATNEAPVQPGGLRKPDPFGFITMPSAFITLTRLAGSSFRKGNASLSNQLFSTLCRVLDSPSGSTFRRPVTMIALHNRQVLAHSGLMQELCQQFSSLYTDDTHDLLPSLISIQRTLQRTNTDFSQMRAFFATALANDSRILKQYIEEELGQPPCPNTWVSIAQEGSVGLLVKSDVRAQFPPPDGWSLSAWYTLEQSGSSDIFSVVSFEHHQLNRLLTIRVVGSRLVVRGSLLLQQTTVQMPTAAQGWSHLVMTCSNTGEMALSVNGCQLSTKLQYKDASANRIHFIIGSWAQQSEDMRSRSPSLGSDEEKWVDDCVRPPLLVGNLILWNSAVPSSCLPLLDRIPPQWVADLSSITVKHLFQDSSLYSLPQSKSPLLPLAPLCNRQMFVFCADDGVSELFQRDPSDLTSYTTHQVKPVIIANEANISAFFSSGQSASGVRILSPLPETQAAFSWEEAEVQLVRATTVADVLSADQSLFFLLNQLKQSFLERKHASVWLLDCILRLRVSKRPAYWWMHSTGNSYLVSALVSAAENWESCLTQGALFKRIIDQSCSSTRIIDYDLFSNVIISRPLWESLGDTQMDEMLETLCILAQTERAALKLMKLPEFLMSVSLGGKLSTTLIPRCRALLRALCLPSNYARSPSDNHNENFSSDASADIQMILEGIATIPCPHSADISGDVLDFANSPADQYSSMYFELLSDIMLALCRISPQLCHDIVEETGMVEVLSLLLDHLTSSHNYQAYFASFRALMTVIRFTDIRGYFRALAALAPAGQVNQSFPLDADQVSLFLLLADSKSQFADLGVDAAMCRIENIVASRTLLDRTTDVLQDFMRSVFSKPAFIHAQGQRSLALIQKLSRLVGTLLHYTPSVITCADILTGSQKNMEARLALLALRSLVMLITNSRSLHVAWKCLSDAVQDFSEYETLVPTTPDPLPQLQLPPTIAPREALNVFLPAHRTSHVVMDDSSSIGDSSHDMELHDNSDALYPHSQFSESLTMSYTPQRGAFPRLTTENPGIAPSPGSVLVSSKLLAFSLLCLQSFVINAFSSTELSSEDSYIGPLRDAYCESALRALGEVGVQTLTMSISPKFERVMAHTLTVSLTRLALGPGLLPSDRELYLRTVPLVLQISELFEVRLENELVNALCNFEHTKRELIDTSSLVDAGQSVRVELARHPPIVRPEYLEQRQLTLPPEFGNSSTLVAQCLNEQISRSGESELSGERVTVPLSSDLSPTQPTQRRVGQSGVTILSRLQAQQQVVTISEAARDSAVFTMSQCVFANIASGGEIDTILDNLHSMDVSPFMHLLASLPLATMLLFASTAQYTALALVAVACSSLRKSTASDVVEHAILSVPPEVPVTPKMVFPNPLVPIVWRVLSWPCEQISVGAVVESVAASTTVSTMALEETSLFAAFLSVEAHDLSVVQDFLNELGHEMKTAYDVLQVRSAQCIDKIRGRSSSNSEETVDWHLAESLSRECWNPDDFTLQLPPVIVDSTLEGGQQTRSLQSHESSCGRWNIPKGVARTVNGSVMWALNQFEGPGRKRIRLTPFVGPDEETQLTQEALRMGGVTDECTLDMCGDTALRQCDFDEGQLSLLAPDTSTGNSETVDSIFLLTPRPRSLTFLGEEFDSLTFDVLRVTVLSVALGQLSVSRGGIFFSISQQGQYDDNDILTILRELTPTNQECFVPSGLGIPLQSLKEVHMRRYAIVGFGLEFFFSDGRQYYFVFPGKQQVKQVLDLLARFHTEDPGLFPSLTYLYSKENLATRLNNSMHRWTSGLMSNYDYLMEINTLSGRSFNDISQWPVMPQVIADWTSDRLDLTNEATFRDLSKPLGAIGPERLEKFISVFRETKAMSPADLSGVGGRPYYYGHLYSHSAIASFFLWHLEPFASIQRALQSGYYEASARQFLSLEQHWRASAFLSQQEVSELTPEFFTTPEAFEHLNAFALAPLPSGETVGAVKLPPWAHNSARSFIRQHRMALESPYVTSKLGLWIDLIFGYKQRGSEAENAHNVFPGYCYLMSKNLEGARDQMRCILHSVYYFGHVPIQLFPKAHPQPLFLGSLEVKPKEKSEPVQVCTLTKVSQYPIADTVVYSGLNLKGYRVVYLPTLPNLGLSSRIDSFGSSGSNGDSGASPQQAQLHSIRGCSSHEVMLPGSEGYVLLFHSPDRLFRLIGPDGSVIASIDPSFCGFWTSISCMRAHRLAAGVWLLVAALDCSLVVARLELNSDSDTEDQSAWTNQTLGSLAALNCPTPRTEPRSSRLFAAKKQIRQTMSPLRHTTSAHRETLVITGTTVVFSGSSPISSLALSMSWGIAIVGASDGAVTAIDVVERRTLWQVTDSDLGGVDAIAISPSTGDIAASIRRAQYSHTSSLYLWTINGRAICCANINSVVTSLCFSSDLEGTVAPRLYASIREGKDGRKSTIRLFSSCDLSPLRRICLEDHAETRCSAIGSVSSIAISNDGRVVFAGTSQGNVAIVIT